ncbi:hypothetical protein [Paenarthrobacter sp. C1]|uniref:hypothetical protein n=1 Tax=Paenarthrobacter sp. C1 TaxID=3400220 RepID=UPI003BF569F2
MTVTITHPGARLLAPALDTLADVVAGDWTTAARLCANKMTDPAAAELALEVAAVHAGVTRIPRQPYAYRAHHRFLVIDEHHAVVAAALDLHMRLWLGAWDTLEQVAPSGAKPLPGWNATKLLKLRSEHQVPGGWARKPYALTSLFLAPPAAQLAHQVLVELGAATMRPVPVAGGPAVVRVS